MPEDWAISSLRAQRLRVRVRGAVQGVGFRPFVCRLARRYALGGFVANDAEGVLIEVEGEQVGKFVAALAAEYPPLAQIDAIESETAAPCGEQRFAIAASRSGAVTTRIPPDAATCEACLDELFDPASRFYLYPFVTCTHCGPRFTITRRLPYDRPQTSMAAFRLCRDCERDYRDPGSRRFHAEAIACPRCGPRLSHSIEHVLAELRSGAIVALKGLGGFHLLCDATSERTVARLRQRKGRDAKPFAVMVASEASLDRIAAPSAAERTLIRSIERPIVLLPDRGALAPSVAPRLNRLGVMLPCTPLHHLIFHAAAGHPEGRDWQDAPVDLALVATSANPGGEPLVIDNEEARHRLAAIADLIVTHDRPIAARLDDSVMAVLDGAPTFVRRARGHVPRPIALPREVPPVLALGASLKATVAVTRGREAFVSQHIGDLDRAAAVRFFEETVHHLLSILDVTPVAVAHDLHPDFASTRFAQGLGRPAVPVQHHHAHAAAIAAEHGIEGPLLGLILDGFGLGPDGSAWGGELLQVEGPHFVRLGHLRPLGLPGGDAAAREPWRMAAAVLHALGRGEEIAARFAGRPAARHLWTLLADPALPLTPSAGRLFDAAAGLLGVCSEQSYEGEAAAKLEALVRRPRIAETAILLSEGGGVLDTLPLLQLLARPGLDPALGAEIFHGTLAAGLADWVEQAAWRCGLRRVALGGGCFLNRVLSETLAAALRARGLEPLCARALPPNDGGLSLGQAAIAAAALEAGDVAGQLPKDDPEPAQRPLSDGHEPAAHTDP